MRSVQVHDVGLKWRPLEDAEVQARLLSACKRWENTRYMTGQQQPDQGVDCVRFVCAVLDEMFYTKTEIPRSIQDRSLHDPEGAKRIAEIVKGYYPHHRILEPADRLVEPGDVIVTGHSRGGPGHAILVGAEPNTVWQALRHGVHRGGMGLMRHFQHVFAIFRPDKERWKSACKPTT